MAHIDDPHMAAAVSHYEPETEIDIPRTNKINEHVILNMVQEFNDKWYPLLKVDFGEQKKDDMNKKDVSRLEREY